MMATFPPYAEPKIKNATDDWKILKFITLLVNIFQAVGAEKFSGDKNRLKTEHVARSTHV